jgi:hypothetical protein
LSQSKLTTSTLVNGSAVDLSYKFLFWKSEPADKEFDTEVGVSQLNNDTLPLGP